MKTRKLLRASCLVFCGAVLLGVPRLASAQGFAIGPRMSFVRGDIPSNTPDTRFVGGTIRLNSSPHVVIELAMDYRARTNVDLTERVREVPMQGSLLLLLSRSRLRPYLLGGLGIYTEYKDVLGAKGEVISTNKTRKNGTHLGMGAEMFVGRHAALFADYRFRFVKFGDPETGSEPIDIPGLSKVKLSHRGSMWTSGMAFYF